MKSKKNPLFFVVRKGGALQSSYPGISTYFTEMIVKNSVLAAPSSFQIILKHVTINFQGHIRALALRVLREILRHQPVRFRDYAELTILKILEAHKDPVKEVRSYMKNKKLFKPS